MGDPPPDPEDPYQQSSRQESYQALEQQRSREPSMSQLTVPQEVPQVTFDFQNLSSQGISASQSHQGWSLGASQSQFDNLFQAEEPQGGVEYLSVPLEFQQQPYLEGGGQATHNANLILQQLQQGQGNIFQQLESAYQDPRPDFLGQFNAFQREDLEFGQAARHGPYMRDDPALEFSPSELGFMPFDMEVSEPEPRELAVQNAKAYLLQTSVNCDLSL